MNSTEKIAKLERIIALQSEEIKGLKEQIRMLSEQNNLLIEKIKELETRLKANSRNSSKPPSSDGLKKKPAFAKPENGKKGGQEGHKGNTLKQTSSPDKVKIIPLCSCSNRGCNLERIESVMSEKRQVFELPEPRLTVTEHQNRKGKCPSCGEIQYSDFPERVNAPAQYGNSVKALTTLL